MPVPPAPLEVLETAARERAVTPDHVAGFVRGWIGGVVSDAQMAAWCAAADRWGLSDDALAALTNALLASGDRLELGRLGPVGDVVPTASIGGAAGIVAAPLAAALGVTPAVLVEAAHGWFGGRLDALAAVPGFACSPSLRSYLTGVRDGSCQTVATPERVAPAMARLVALAEQTGMLHGSPVMTALLAARTLAGGAPAVVIDAPYGSAALFDDARGARESMEAITAAADRWGRRVGWVMAPADAPRGRVVGPSLTMTAVAELLGGGGPADDRAVAMALAGRLAELLGTVGDGNGREAAGRALADGSALAAAEAWFAQAGADPNVLHDPESHLPSAPLRLEVVARRAGVVTAIDARSVGDAVRRLGAGRLHAAQVLDPGVGVEVLIGVGEPVDSGEPLAIVHARHQAMGDASVQAVAAAFTVGAGLESDTTFDVVTDRDARAS